MFEKHKCPHNGHVFKKCDLDILLWPWQMTFTLVLKKGFYPKEYICEIWKLFHLPFKSYGQCKNFCGQTDRPKKICPWSIDAGEKKEKMFVMYQHIFVFQQCLQKTFFLGVSTVVIMQRVNFKIWDSMIHLLHHSNSCIPLPKCLVKLWR